MTGADAGDAGSESVVETTSSRGLAIGLLLGVPPIAYGIRGVLVDADDTKPSELALWFVRLAILHDLVIAPAVLALGWIASRIIRDEPTRRVLRASLLTSAAMCLIAYPLVRGYGRSGAVPSALARNYGLGLAIYLGSVSLVAAISIVILRRVRTR